VILSLRWNVLGWRINMIVLRRWLACIRAMPISGLRR